MGYTTKKSLLERVRNGDEISWTEFYQAYRPLIWLRGRDLTLSENENEELVQQVMLEIYKKDIISTFRSSPTESEDCYFKYDPQKGRFRHFLRGIITRQALNILRKRESLPDYMDELENVADEQDTDTAWDFEWRRHILNQALDELKAKVAPETYQIFETYAIQGQKVRKVADFFDVSVGSVYTVKCRCTEYLREIVKTLNDR